MRRATHVAALMPLLALLCLNISAAKAESRIVQPDAAGQEMLIKNSMIAVNHGIITGNYTVLRDLATERFRQNNTAADLASTFAGLRKEKIDLSPILVSTPQLVRAPGFDGTQGKLKYIGFFETRPQAVVFSLSYAVVNGGWMIDEIVISLRPTEAVLSALGKQQSSTRSHTAARSNTAATPVSSSRQYQPGRPPRTR